MNKIAVNENKVAIFPWKVYQTRRITEKEFTLQMGDPKACGVAVICGAISGGLEVIDIDTKYETYPLWDAIREKIPSELFSKLQIVKTRSGGVHLYYQCEVIEGNQKLAQRLPTNEEAKANPQIRTYCIIETRGEAGYVVAPPTKGYEYIKEGVNIISVDEREELFEIMRSFNEVVEEVVIEAHNRPNAKDYGKSPFDDYNSRGDVVKLLVDEGWKFVKEYGDRIYFLRPGGTSEHSGSYNKSIGLFSVFSTNTPFEVGKGYKLAAVFCTLKCGGDFSKAARMLVEMGYGEKKTHNKLTSVVSNLLENGKNEDEIAEILVKKHNASIKEAFEVVERVNSEQGETIEKFWTRDPRNGRPVINRYRLQVFLSEEGGFKLYFYEPNSTIYRLIRVNDDGTIVEASTEQIKRFIKDYIDRLPDKFDGTNPQELLELIYKGAGVYFTDAFFEFFGRAEIDFLRDDKDVGYFPFRNGVVCVSKDKIELKSYGELGKYIWSTQVIDHHITIEEDLDLDKVEYFRFIKRISGDNEERYLYALNLMGYLVHQYKDPSKPFAVILGEETDNEEEGGGTGKGIFVKALSYIIKTVRVDGKNFALDKSFAFQRVDLDTRLVAIEDTRKRVDFEGFYSIITEGITVEKKNKDELFIPYKDSPKIMFTTNYSIPQNGVHAKRRQKVLEFAPYFGKTHTPQDEFGKKLFDDWDKDEWNRFFNLFFLSLQDYLENGVMDMPQSDKMGHKMIKNQFGEEFLNWLLEAVKNTEWVNLEALHLEFLNMYGMDKKDYSRNKFTRAIKCSTKILNVAQKEQRGAIERNKIAIKFNMNDELNKKIEEVVEF